MLIGSVNVYDNMSDGRYNAIIQNKTCGEHSRVGERTLQSSLMLRASGFQYPNSRNLGENGELFFFRARARLPTTQITILSPPLIKTFISVLKRK